MAVAAGAGLLLSACGGPGDGPDAGNTGQADPGTPDPDDPTPDPTGSTEESGGAEAEGADADGAEVSQAGGFVRAENTGELPDAPPDEFELPSTGEVTTSGTVLEDGSGPQLCHYVMESYPPQCGGPDIIGWDWEVHEHEEAEGVRWGDYVLRGEFDPQAREFTLIEDLTEDEAPPAPETDLGTPCPDPEGGWEMEGPERTTEETLQQTRQAAEDLPGYAGVWVDQSLNPVSAEDINEAGEEEAVELESQLNDPEYTILNVRVADDPEGAYEVLREEWGGMLCVSEAAYTEEELLAVQEQLEEIPGMIGSSVDNTTNQLSVQVEYDDGTLQSQLDEHYGPGVVDIESLMQTAE